MAKNQYKSRKKSSSFNHISLRGKYVIGMDEAGRGAWAGPVVAACVCWKGKSPFSQKLDDSKKMMAKNREGIYRELLSLSNLGRVHYGIGIISNEIIDSKGIREANRLAMEQALYNMCRSSSALKTREAVLLVDGRDNYFFHIDAISEPVYVVRGDSIIPQIMAASILAKVTRDKIMTEYGTIFPDYSFEKHKGYGTALHRTIVQSFPILEIHRKSYKPIKLATSGKNI